MMHRLTKTKLFITTLICVGVIFFACRKNTGSGLSVQENVTELQSWLQTYGQSFTNGEMTITNSNGEISTNKLNWNLVSTFKSRKNSFYEVPFVNEKDDNRQTGFSMIFQKNANEIVARVKYSFDNTNPGTAESGYTKVAAFDKLDGKNEASWAWFNGLNFPTKIYRKEAAQTNGTTIQTTAKQKIKNAVAEVCRTLLVPMHIYSCRPEAPDVTICGYIPIGYQTYTICVESPSGDNPPPGGGGGPGPGGGGGGEEGGFNYDEYLEVNNRIIVDSLAGYPCAQNILATMFNLNDSLSSLILNMFGDTNEVDLNFVVDYNMAGTLVDGKTKPSGGLQPSPTGPIPTFRPTISLNPDVLNNATQEYIAITFMHEALHAYIDYYQNLVNVGLWSKDLFASKFPIYATYRYDSLTTGDLAQHNVMVEIYIDKMVTFLKNAYPRIPDSVATAISWGGLSKTTAWKSRSDTNRLKSINLIARDASLAQNQTWRLTKCK